MNKKQQRQQKMLRQQEIVNAAKEAGRDLTAEEQTEFDSLQREIERLNGEIEAEEQQQRGMTPQPNAPPQNPANPEADTQRAIQEERARIRSITELCGEFGMEARSYIESGATLDSVREAALEHVRQHGAPIPANGREYHRKCRGQVQSGSSGRYRNEKRNGTPEPGRWCKTDDGNDAP